MTNEFDLETIDINLIRYYKGLNSDSDELLTKIEKYYKNKYGNYKYNKISVYDDNDNYKGNIQLRIADHTENIFNVDKYGRPDYHLSVIITNKDKTVNRFGMSNAFERRKNEYELVFNSSDDETEIISQIDDLIKEFTNELLSKS
jgi:hypothetical protein